MDVFPLHPESIVRRDAIIKEHQALILEMRRVEKDIENLLRESSPRWKELEKERNALYVRIEPLVEKYWDWIPPVFLSRCPFCGETLRRLFDPVDLRGFWWMDRTQRSRPEPASCGHFRLLLGAVNLNGLPPQGGLFECRPGPDVPFVIQRILDLPKMTVVVSAVPMRCGYIAYPIAYFSEIEPPPRSLTQSWARLEYRFRAQDGRQGWDRVADPHEYDLIPWIKRGKVRWLIAGDLSAPTEPPDRYPFRAVRGAAKPQVVLGRELSYVSG
ncbi:MAG: hypothetical protein Q8Q08_00525 [Candidatus Omnitrophota bacterium]|nr:hypothetical protein [Candidatus Omnitrophota bacterium]MDZ4241898.1 hypothetical protein [Candidatus Omnitrophota bacterium]